MRYAVRILNEYDIEADSPEKAMTLALKYEASRMMMGVKKISVQLWDDRKEEEEMTRKGMGLMQMLDVIMDGDRMCRRPLSYDENGDVKTWRAAFHGGPDIRFTDVHADMSRIGTECGRILLLREDVEATDWEEYEWQGNPNCARYASFAVGARSDRTGM